MARAHRMPDLNRVEFESRLLGYGFRKIGNALGYWALPHPFSSRYVCEHSGGESHWERMAWLLRAWDRARFEQMPPAPSLDERDRM